MPSSLTGHRSDSVANILTERQIPLWSEVYQECWTRNFHFYFPACP